MNNEIEKFIEELKIRAITKEVLEKLTEYADQGNDLAQYTLGSLYEKGEVIEEDIEKAIEYYKKSAEQNNDLAQLALGKIYYYNYWKYDNIEQDEKKALKLFTKSAKNGNAEAQYDLGQYYYMKDYKKSLYWLKKSAKQEFAPAQCLIGDIYYVEMYEEDTLLNKEYIDHQKAFYWYKKSADNGYYWGHYSLGILYLTGKGTEQNYKLAFKHFKEATKKEDCTSAHYQVGKMYFNGWGVKQNYKKARYWYKKATSDEEEEYAFFALGEMYEYGIGVKQDYKKALNYYHAGWEYSQELQGKINFKLGDFSKNGKGTEQDFRGAEHYFRYGTRDHEEDSDCEYNLGLMYELGLVVDRDVKKAIELYNKAIKFSEQFEEKEYILAKKKLEFLSRNKEKNIDNIDLEKTHNLALEYYQKKDLQKAFELFTKSAENGNPEAQLALAKMYEKGEGCLKDSFENLYWYSRTAKNGNLEAQLFLGDFYINGIELSKNFALAFEFFYLASENENPKAQCSIGIMYELGLGGVQQNSQKAFEYYKKSAEQNYEKAKEKLDLLSPKKSNIKSNSFFRLAYTYYCMGGNKKNLNIAFKYFYKASLMGNCEAQFYLGDMYESGEGTEKDDLEAIYWYFKSSQNGNKESENKFKILSSMKDGIPSNVWEYYRFFEEKKLADRGDANAQFEIAQKYRTGDGVQNLNRLI